MRFEVLGPLRVREDGRSLRVGGPREKKILAALLLYAGRPLALERLAAVVWGDRPPATGRAQVHNAISALRRALGPGVPVTRSGSGFRLDLARHELDLAEFTELVAEAERLVEPAEALRRLASALTLWRGAALEDLRDGILAAEAARLEEQRLCCLQRRIEVELDLGRHAQLVGELAALTAEHPLREKLVALRMRALDRAGRRAEALDLYADLRHRLAADLGLDPSAEVQRLHAMILRDESADGEPEEAVVPRQLPVATRHFVGRSHDLKALDALADDATTATRISVIAGAPGVGKTTLAVHWAHQSRDRFPDGQLYVNLRGFDPTRPPTPPAEAIRGLLDAFAFPPERIPADPDAQAAMYRSLLAGKRVLVVLDNARDAEQVHPLLPGAPGCLVLITSRRQLTSLVAATGAHLISLDALPADEARQFLACRLGVRRVVAEPHAAAELIDICGRLPLALAVVTARAAAHPSFPLRLLADQLRTRARLDALHTGDKATDLRGVFSWSYQALTPAAARVFRLLGLHPGQEATAAAIASLTALSPHQVQPILTELTTANLVTEQVPGRYAVHGLLHAYAAELTRGTDGDRERYLTTHRILDHYLHTAQAAAIRLSPTRDPIALAPPLPGVVPERFAGHEDALRWYAAEQSTLFAAMRYAVRTGLDAHVWQFAWTLLDYLQRSGCWQEQAATQTAALNAARRLGDKPGQAQAHHGLGRAHARLGRYDEAHHHLQQALDLFGALGDTTRQGLAHMSIAHVFERQGSYRTELRHFRQAFSLYQKANHRNGQGNALAAIGWVHTLLGAHQRALNYCHRALPLLRELGDRHAEAGTWDTLGHANHHLGHHDQAIVCYRRAIGIYQSIGDRPGEADALHHLGDTHHAADDPVAAGAAWRQALAIVGELGHPDADQVRAKLARL